MTELVTGHRHRPRAAADRGGRAAGRDRARAALAGTRSRSGSTRRTPRSGFAPVARAGSSGSALPIGPGVRLDTHVEAGATIPPTYDSLIAKLIVWDADRPAAIARGLRALGELEIEGIATTRDFALDVLRERCVRERRVHDLATSRALGREPLATRGAPDGALPALPVGPDRPAARHELRGRGRRLRAGTGRVGGRRARTSSTRGSPPSPATGPRSSWARSSGTSFALASTSSRKVRSRSKWRSTRQSPWRSGTRPRTRAGS